jgi:hypothetical protein
LEQCRLNDLKLNPEVSTVAGSDTARRLPRLT